MRYWLGSISIHVFLINIVWVGFSVEKSPNHNRFIYLSQAIKYSHKDSYLDKTNNDVDNSIFDTTSSAFSSLWLNMRKLNKPKEEF